jgi:uncharacterized protein (TIGR02145 family)
MKRSNCSCTLYLFFAILPFVITGCDDKIPPPDNKELLTNVVWGETNYTITDPALYTCVFESSGKYYTTYKGYETASYTWQLKNDNILKIDQYEVEITNLTPEILEYRGDASFLGFHFKQTYHLQALKETVAATIGFSDLKMTSVKFHGIIRSCSPSQISFEYGPTASYGQSVSGINFTGPVNKHISSALTGLTPGTTYHYRIRVENEKGIFLGKDQKVKTFSDQLMTDADNNKYFTTVIGNQIWMAENLRTTKFNDGTTIPKVTDNEAWNKLNTPAYCWFDNDSTANNGSGAIYNWYTVASGKICPAGWHIPSALEWSLLLSYLAGREIELMKGDYENVNDFLWVGGLNQTGFSAERSLMRETEGYFSGTEYYHLWTSSENDSEEGRFGMIFYNYIGISQRSKRSGLPLRCLKD